MVQAYSSEIATFSCVPSRRINEMLSPSSVWTIWEKVASQPLRIDRIVMTSRRGSVWCSSSRKVGEALTITTTRAEAANAALKSFEFSSRLCLRPTVALDWYTREIWNQKDDVPGFKDAMWRAATANSPSMTYPCMVAICGSSEFQKRISLSSAANGLAVLENAW